MRNTLAPTALRALLSTSAVAVVVAVTAVLLASACSKSGSSGGPADETPDASAPDANAEAALPGVDAGAPEVIVDAPLDVPDVLFNYDDCTNVDFANDDESAPDASRRIIFSFHANTQQYAPRCMTIQAGQSITWEGDFGDHPLVGAGGDIPNPVDIAMITTGTEGTITFANAGWYGFECAIHEAPAEYGAILVTP